MAPLFFSIPSIIASAAVFFLLSWGLGRLVRKFASSQGIYAMSSAQTRVALWGGLAFMLPCAVYAPFFLGLSLGRAAVFFLAILSFLLFGLLDDILSFSPLPQICMQAITSLALLFALFPSLSIDIWGVALAFVVFSIACMNAMNWLDGLDGLASITAISAFLPIAAVFLSRGEYAGAGLLIVFMATLAGFLLHNISPAKLYMGTAGSMGLGVFAGVVVLAFPDLLGGLLCALALPLGDACRVSLERMVSGIFPWQGGDRRHLHYALFDAGLGLKKILFFYAGASFVFSLFGVELNLQHSAFWLFVLPAILVVLLPPAFLRLHKTDGKLSVLYHNK